MPLTETPLRCDQVVRFADAFVDGEFTGAERCEIEDHLGACDGCAAQVRTQAEFRHRIKQTGPKEIAPDLLRQRIAQQLSKNAVAARRKQTRRLLMVASIPAAAALVIAAWHRPIYPQAQLADIVRKHSRNLPVEISGNNDAVKKWYADKVNFPVSPPRLSMAKGEVALRGGRLAQIGDHEAAYLVYDASGNKVSVFIFDPGDEALEVPRRQPMMIDNRPVYIDAERGYNVARYRDRGVGYAIASDLGEDDMLKLVSSAVSH